MLPFQVYKYTAARTPFRYVVLGHGEEVYRDGQVSYWTLIKNLTLCMQMRLPTMMHEMHGKRDGFMMVDPKHLLKEVSWEMYLNSFAEQVRQARVRAKSAATMQRRFRVCKNAALIIQSKLRESMSNPEFALCRSRLQREFAAMSDI